MPKQNKALMLSNDNIGEQALQALAAIDLPEELEFGFDTTSWMCYFSAMMPVADWLVTAIIPHVRVDLLNSIQDGIIPDVPSLNLTEDQVGNSGYKRGVGRRCISIAQLPPYHVQVNRHSEMHKKENATQSAYLTATKGGYSTTLSAGYPNFLYKYDCDLIMGRPTDAFSILNTYGSGVNRVAVPNSKKFHTNLVKRLGENFFDVDKGYIKNFKLEKPFSVYFQQATGMPLMDMLRCLSKEFGLAGWVFDHGVDPEKDYANESAYATAFLKNYINWLDDNVTSFDLISRPMVGNEMARMLRADGSSTEEVTGLGDPKLAQCTLPRDVAHSMSPEGSLGSRLDYTYNVRDYFIDCVMAARDVTISFKANMPLDVAEYATQTKGSDDYYLSQIVQKCHLELLDFITYEGTAKQMVELGGSTVGQYGVHPVETSIAALEKRTKTKAKGVNSKGLGMMWDGMIVYIPTELNDIKSNRQGVEEYFNNISVNKGEKLLALRDPLQISGNQRAFGHEMQDRPRPSPLRGTKPLYVDWGIGVIVGTNDDNLIVPLLNLEHITPVTDGTWQNYAKAAILQIVPDSSSMRSDHVLSVSKLLSQTKPNQFRAITEPLTMVFKNHINRAVNGADLAAFFVAAARQLFNSNPMPNGAPLVPDDAIESVGSMIARVPNSSNPIGILFASTQSLYNSAYARLIATFGDEDEISEEFDEITQIAQFGQADFATLAAVHDYKDSPSLFTRCVAFVLQNIWKAVKDHFDLFTNVTSFEQASKYYGTLMGVVDFLDLDIFNLNRGMYNTALMPPDMKTKEGTVSYQPNPLPGCVEGYSMLPHQMRVDFHMDMANKLDIEYTILAAEAGAGKTHNILNDVMRKLEAGLIERPLVLCPGYLEKNYIEDAAYVYEGRLNVVILDTISKNYSPEFGNPETLDLDGLLKMIQTAPKNTVFVTSYSFLSAGNKSSYSIPLGTEDYYVNPNLEMLLEAGFDAVYADESQELRNEGTAKSDLAKAVFYRAKYRILATGTFLNTSPSDIPAQTAMLDPSIFGSHKDFEEYYAEDDGRKGGKISKLRDGRKNDLVVTLGSGASFIQVKRKEWAALLPNRKDSYHVMQLDPEGTQWKIYQSVLKEVMDEIQKALNQNKAMVKDANDATDEEAQQNIEDLLRPFLQRLEMLLITPALDEHYEELLKTLDLDYDENYVSPAVDRCIEIIRAHLKGVDLVNPPNGATREEILEEYKDFMGLDSIENLDELDFVEPIPGKILVFCNYNTSVDAVYNALPDDLRKMAIRYESSKKDEHIFEFKNNPDKKILIGIQSSLAIGHNFQFCTRLIRLEQVWSPGEVEQGESRINRPDPKNKGAQRSQIYYDWIVVDGTIQITKMARLISRMIVNNQVMEHGNQLYDDVQYLPLLVMNLDTIANNCWFQAPEDLSGTSTRSLMTYLNTKNQIDSIQKIDYQRWAENYTGPTEPVEIRTGNIIEGSAVIVNIPPIPGQVVANADKFNVVNVAKYETMMSSRDLDLTGMRCLTPEGDGIITQQTGSKIRVDINGSTYSFDRLAVNLYLDDKYGREDLLKATGLTKFQTISGTKVSVKGLAKSDEKVKSKKKEIEDEQMSDEQIIDELGIKQAIEEEVKVLKTKRKKEVPMPEPTDMGEPDGEIEVVAANVNGMLCAMLSSEDADLLNGKAARQLKRLGYQLEPDMWFASVPNKIVMQELIDKFENKFDIPDRYLDDLYSMLDAFNTGRRKMFNAEHATSNEIREYWLNDAKLARAKDPKVLAPMVFVYDGELYVALHMDQPSSKVAKRMRITNLTWQTGGGIWMKMYYAKKACAADLKVLEQSYTILNKDDLRKSVNSITITKTGPVVIKGKKSTKPKG